MIEVLSTLIIISIFIITILNITFFTYRVRQIGMQQYEASKVAQGIVEELKVNNMDIDEETFLQVYKDYEAIVTIQKKDNIILYKVDLSVSVKNHVFNLYGYLGGIYGNYLYKKTYTESPIEYEELLY